MPASAAEVFAWHARSGAFERLNPPWAPARIVDRTDWSNQIGHGQRATIVIRCGPMGLIRRRWIAEHRDTIPGVQFRDVQIEGPFAHWEHLHRLEQVAASWPSGAGGTAGSGHCALVDEIQYALPLGALGNLIAGRMVRSDLSRAFAYRHRVTAGDLAAHAHWRERPRLTIWITGASGALGSVLCAYLSTAGHTVRRLVRGAPRTGEPFTGDGLAWDPASGRVTATPEEWERMDAVIHLAGEGIASHRWTPEFKKRIRASRVGPTRALCQTIAEMARPSQSAASPSPLRPPRTLIVASAVGFYGNRGEELVDESSAPGEGFLADVCREWEASADPAREAGLRVAHVRLGLVVTPAAGGLAKMLPPFLFGLGGPMGSGTQASPWIAIDDAIGAIEHILMSDQIAGPVNLVAPELVTNAEFARALGLVLRRPAALPLPAFALRLMLGEMAGPLLLDGARAMPRALQASEYDFRYPKIEPALAHLLGRVP